jgi:AcrR family transcriptional regulator
MKEEGRKRTLRFRSRSTVAKRNAPLRFVARLLAPMGSDAPPRPLRSDAERNRQRIIDAGRVVFAAHGLGVGVDVVAREAGVGVGTLYRRFPTKEALLQAIVDDRTAALAERLAELEAIEDPWEAFAAAAATLTERAAGDRGFFEALQAAVGVLEAPDCARVKSIAAIEPFLRRAQAAGVVRADLVGHDVLALCVNAGRLPAWRAELEPDLWRRYLAILLDGMRPDAAHALPHPPASATPPARKRAASA